MTDFVDWMRKWELRELLARSEVVADLANLAAQMEGDLEQIRSGEIPEAVKREGLFACLTYKETIAALALAACRDFQEKYE